jgi:hypothetical protein
MHESMLWLSMGLLQIKCIKFYQVTYFDATPLMITKTKKYINIIRMIKIIHIGEKNV